MNLSKLQNLNINPDEFDVIIEIPLNSSNIKYEFDKDFGLIVVDRFLKTPMYYPCNYGFIPNTLSGDGDPCDVLVVSHHEIIPGAMIRVRPVGAILMEDESGEDEKILAVPISKIDPSFDNIKDCDNIEPSLKNKLIHFFEHYKDLDKNKWVKVKGFTDKNHAKELIEQSIQRAKTQKL
jgi:inorganic pyrophosphatase